jgi:4-diphosphocytidyl-2-C-methyl-D-erythritol kinase
MVRLRANCKINLFLRVLAREVSGFHQLETLFAALEFGDDLILEPAGRGVTLEVMGADLGPVEENLAFRAARGFLAEAGVGDGVRIHLEKRIPVQAGLGGGSSDAAATLRGLDVLFPGRLSRDDLFRLAASLGSDVPFFLSPSPLALAWGRGDRLLPLPALPRAPVLLALTRVGVKTPLAYRLLARHREETPPDRQPALFKMEALGDWGGVTALAENHFQEVVFRAFPPLKDVFGALQATGPRLCLLAGSGGALFAVYGSREEALKARDRLKARFPGDRFVLTWTSQKPEEPPRASGG